MLRANRTNIYLWPRYIMKHRIYAKLDQSFFPDTDAREHTETHTSTNAAATAALNRSRPS